MLHFGRGVLRRGARTNGDVADQVVFRCDGAQEAFASNAKEDCVFKTASHVGSGLTIEKDLGITLTSTATTEMDNNMKAMNLTGQQITMLSLSIKTGQVQVLRTGAHRI